MSDGQKYELCYLAGFLDDEDVSDSDTSDAGDNVVQEEGGKEVGQNETGDGKKEVEPDGEDSGFVFEVERKHHLTP